MPKTQIATFAAPVAQLAPADASGATWVQLCPAGSFRARDGRGPFDAGHGAALQAIIDRTRQYAGTTEPVIDYDHQSVFGAKDGVGGTARAAGWIKEMEVRDDGIWGRVEWTAAAAQAIKDSEYRYLSPVLTQAKNGSVLAILMAALTNTPALDLAQVAASALFSIDIPEEEISMDKILAALGLAAGATEAAALSAIGELVAGNKALATAAGVDAGAKPEAIIAAFSAKTAPDPSQYVPLAAVTQLQNEVKSLQQALSADKAEDAVALAVKDGKLAPALKDWGLKYAKADLSGFQAYTAGAPVLTAQQTTPAPQRKSGDAPLLDEAQAAAATALGVDPKAYAATLAAEAAKLETL